MSSFDQASREIERSLGSQDPIRELRFAARRLAGEGIEKKVLHRVFLIELLRFKYSNLVEYRYADELRETLELLVLWTSVFHPQFPEGWISGWPYKVEDGAKDSATVKLAEAWLSSVLNGGAMAEKLSQRLGGTEGECEAENGM